MPKMPRGLSDRDPSKTQTMFLPCQSADVILNIHNAKYLAENLIIWALVIAIIPVFTCERNLCIWENLIDNTYTPEVTSRLVLP